MTQDRLEVLIVGAGFAGASTAFHLSQVFRGSIGVIERESVPGAHASGHNASLILPFLFNTVNFASPLPTSFAIMVLVYAYIKYDYFSLENLVKGTQRT